MSYFKILFTIILSLQFLFLAELKAQELNSLTENNSKFINQYFPSEMDTGKKYVVWISYRNTGNSVWSSISSLKDEQFKIAFLNDKSNGIAKPFGNFSNVLLKKEIKPGETATIEFEITAPSVPGNYDSQWRMMKGDEYFGDASEKITVNVSDNRLISKNASMFENTETPLAEDAVKDNTPVNSSAFEKQTISKLMKCTFKSAVSVTMKNNGSTVWSTDNYFLSPVDDKMQPMSQNPLGIGNIKLPKDAEPGTSVTFKFQIIAPSQPGNYTLQFAMTENGKVYGNPSELVEVTVMK